MHTHVPGEGLGMTLLLECTLLLYSPVDLIPPGDTVVNFTDAEDQLNDNELVYVHVCTCMYMYMKNAVISFVTNVACDV